MASWVTDRKTNSESYTARLKKNELCPVFGVLQVFFLIGHGGTPQGDDHFPLPLLSLLN